MEKPPVILKFSDQGWSDWFRAYFSSKGYPIAVICPDIENATCPESCPAQSQACSELAKSSGCSAESGVTGAAPSVASPLTVVLLCLDESADDKFDNIRRLKSIHTVIILAVPQSFPFDRLSQYVGAGADDFMLTPFKPEELEARIGIWVMRKFMPHGKPPVIDRRSVERRNQQNALPPLLSRQGGTDANLKIDERAKKVVIDGQEYSLSPKEFLLLSLLASEPGKVFSSKEIIRHLWNHESDSTIDDLHQFVRLLRRRIESNPSAPRWIRTVKGFGYMLSLVNSHQSGAM